MTIRPPQVVLVASVALFAFALAGAPAPADAAGGKGAAAHSGGGGGGGASYGRGGHGGGSHYRSYRSHRSQPGTKRRAPYSRNHRSYGYNRYRPYRYRGYGYGVRYSRYPYRYGRHSYSPYYYDYARYSYVAPTPIYFYSPSYYGYYPGRSYYEYSLQRQVNRLQNELVAERYSRFYWRARPPYYPAPGPSAEGSCLYGPDEALIFNPEGKDCASSLAAR